MEMTTEELDRVMVDEYAIVNSISSTEAKLLSYYMQMLS